jgi:hypothetical protein
MSVKGGVYWRRWARPLLDLTVPALPSASFNDQHRRQPGATLPPHALDHSGTPMQTSDYAVQELVSSVHEAYEAKK